jgi:hypothetical protein
MPTLFRAAGSKSRDSMDQRRARAVRAATAVARAYGLDVRRPRVLADANNTIVHLRPAPVVAKVGTTWIRDGAGVLAQELSVAMHVASRSGPMPPPARGIPVEVHHHDGLAMTFWCYVKGSCDNPPAAVTAGSLRRLHSALAEYPARLHSFRAELDELATALVDPARTPTLDRADRAFLRSTLGSLIAELDYQDGPVIVLHGDPHEGNRIATDGEVLWIDWRPHASGPLNGISAPLTRRTPRCSTKPTPRSSR